MIVRGSYLGWAFASLVLTWSASGIAQSPSTDDIMARATRYVDDFVRRFPGVVAEERYRQEAAPPRRQRELTSEFLLVKPTESGNWYQFRDVIEVDGRPLPDRQDRLTQLFVTPTGDSLRRAAQVTEESARYNIIDIGTLNKPLTALSFLQRQYRDHFLFSPQRLDTNVSPTARLVEFREVRVPTLLRSNINGIDMPAAGRLWVDERSGAVLQTELWFEVNYRRNEITTIFGFNSDLGVYVPVEMRERYDMGPVLVTGIAIYSRFRRYQVLTEERLR